MTDPKKQPNAETDAERRERLGITSGGSPIGKGHGGGIVFYGSDGTVILGGETDSDKEQEEHED